MPNSSITLQNVIDFARTMPDLMPVLAVGGFSQQPALTIANDTMASMLSPTMNWKWNRYILPFFYTNALQADYAVPGVVNLGWIEHGFLIDYNNTSIPPPLYKIEVVRDLELTTNQTSRPCQVCWLPNDQLGYAPAWTALTKYQQITGTPSNPNTNVQPTQLLDPNGNLWVISNNLNATVTTGSVQPTWPTTPVYPTYQSPNISATTVTDGTVIWKAINPKGQGFRLNPLPALGGLYYLVSLFGQMRPPQFTSVTQTLEPIPDDFAPYFRQGFIAHAYRHAQNKDVRAKFQDEFRLWQSAMVEATSKSAREREEAGFYPSENVMSNGYPYYVGPANPWWPGGF